MKRKSKWLSVCVAVIMLATMMPFGMVANAASTPINNATDLKNMALDGDYNLNADITISDAWTPIGTSNAPFMGTLDGGGHKITFDNVAATSGSNYSGIFGYIGSGATVSNINIAKNLADHNSKITIKDKYIKYGSFIAGVNAGTIQNCSVTGSEITSSAAVYDSYRLGLIAGENENTGKIQNCSVTGSKITLGTADYGSYYVGSIAGENKGEISKSYSTSDLNLKLYTMGYTNMEVGGITGENSGTITQTYNTGSVAVEVEQYKALIAESYVGGIAGINKNEINNSYNTGNISSYSFYSLNLAGGIAGYNNLTGKISCTYNAGLINGYYNGGIAGLNAYNSSTSGTISNSYYLSGLTGSPQYSYKQGNSSSSTPVIGNGFSQADMQTLSNFTGFSFTPTPDAVWTIDNSDGSAYKFPTLVNATHIEAAVNTTDFAGGNGKLYNPYQVTSTTQLDKVRNDLSSCYKLNNDITFTDWDYSSEAQNTAKNYLPQTLDTAAIVSDYSETPPAITSITIPSDVKASSLADLIQQNLLPKYVLVNNKVYVPITDWEGTFNGTSGGSLTPVWKAPVGFSGTKPSLTLTVNVASALGSPSITDDGSGNEFQWNTGYSNTIKLSIDENIVTLADLVASGKLPNIVKVRSGSEGSYTYTWKHINPSTWAEVTGTFNALSTTPSSYSLTASTDDTATTVSVTVNVKRAQTASISTYKDGQFYNGGLKWIPIGETTSGGKYTSTVNAFKGCFDGNGKSVYNLQINAIADANTNAYAGLFAVNEGLITNFTIDDYNTGVAIMSSSLSNNKGETRELLTNLFGYGITFGDGSNGYGGSSIDITASKNASAGMIAGYNKLAGLIDNASNKSEKGNIKTLASVKSYAGGITGLNEGTLNKVVNFESVTSNSNAVDAAAGGIAGENYYIINEAINTGTVIAGYGSSMSINNIDAYSNTNLSAGGITGTNGTSYAKITKSYNVGGVRTQITSSSTTDAIYSGGLIGYDEGNLADTISDSVCWTPTAKYSVEYANDAKTGSTGLTNSSLIDIQTNKLGSGITNAYTGDTFLSFSLPTGFGTNETGAFASKTAAENYLAGITSGGTIYNSKTGALTTTAAPQAAGTSTGGCQLMKVKFTASGATDETSEFITKNTSVAITGIEITTGPTQSKYFVGQEIDGDGIVVTATYSDSSTALFPYSGNDFYTLTTDYDKTKSTGSSSGTTYNITASYDTNGSAAGGVVTSTCPITVYTVDHITLNTDNVQKKFVVDDPANSNGFNDDGIVVTAYNTGNSFNSVIDSGYTVTKPTDMSTVSTTLGVPDKEVTVTYKTKTATYDIECVTTSIKLNNSSQALLVSKTCNLISTVSPYLGGKVTYTSDKPLIATVSDSGEIEAVSEGTATITATYGGVSKTCNVTVSKPAAPTLSTPTIVSGTANVALNWSQVSVATGYVIYRSTSSGSLGSKITTITSNATTTYTDTGLSGATTYYYTVYSYVDSDTDAYRSVPSSQLSVTTPVIEITAASGSGYTVNQGNATLSGVRTGTSVSALKSGVNQTVIVKNQSGQEITGGNIGTGMTVCLSGGGDPLTIVVKGDTSGDGKISPTDLIQLKSQILQKSSLGGVYFTAGDVNGDGKISPTDLVQIKSHILGRTLIN